VLSGIRGTGLSPLVASNNGECIKSRWSI
jgi:hypothetical protein